MRTLGVSFVVGLLIAIGVFAWVNAQVTKANPAGLAPTPTPTSTAGGTDTSQPNSTVDTSQPQPKPPAVIPADWLVDRDEHRDEHARMVGTAATYPKLDEWHNSPPLDEQKLSGKVVALMFFTTWRDPAKAEIPHANDLQARYASQGLVMIGVCTSEHDQDQFDAVAQQTKLSFPAGTDPDCVVQKQWAVTTYPTYALIDRTGVIRAIGVKPEHIEDAIKLLLAEPGQ